MKTRFKEVRPVRSRSYLKHKLISAAALLLVSSIMLVSTSYAWYVLSTAPEVSNIKTQVGANGALEIALLNENSWDDLKLLDMGDIDESLTPDAAAVALAANLRWGNLVNLDDASYGLDEIVLQPSRLYIEPYGTNEYKVNTALLKTPIYGADGRVEGLDLTAAKGYTYANGTFSNTLGYGVRAIGTVSSRTEFQRGMDDAKAYLSSSAGNARNLASMALTQRGNALANVVVQFAVSGKTQGYTNDDVQAILDLANDMNDALSEIEMALRYTFLGYISAQGAYFVETDETTGTSENVVITEEIFQDKEKEILEGGLPLKALLEIYPGITDLVKYTYTVGEEEVTEDIEDYIDKLTLNQNALGTAIDDCEDLIASGNGSYDWDRLTGIIRPLVDINGMEVNGQSIDELKKQVIVDGEIDYTKALELLQGGVNIVIPAESGGILGDIADLAGEYTATVPVAVDAMLSGKHLEFELNVLMSVEGTKPSHLNTCINCLRTATVPSGGAASASISDYYGYAIDLAFRTNADESNLLLQTEAANRIYADNPQNAALQGGGSYMSFATSGGLSVTKMVKLMSGIRVVLMDESQVVLGIAALDCTLGQDVYTVLDSNTQAQTGMYAYLDDGTGSYQTSDLINYNDFSDLESVSHVTFNPTTGKVTAKLYLCQFEMTKSTTTNASGDTVVRVDEDGNELYTGGLTIGDPIEGGVITALVPDVPQIVTALVYLDGSVVNNATVAANSMYSMTGTLNLQFSSSVELLPLSNSQLRTEGEGVIYTELDTVPYRNGYLYFANTLCKVKDDYGIYVGSDDNIYYHNLADENAGYVNLTEDYTTALEPVTVTLDSDSISLTVNGTDTLTATLSDSSLQIVGCELNMATGGASEIATVAYDADTGEITLTGTAVGEGTHQIILVVQVGSGDSTATNTFRIAAENEVTVTVAAAAADPDTE